MKTVLCVVHNGVRRRNCRGRNDGNRNGGLSKERINENVRERFERLRVRQRGRELRDCEAGLPNNGRAEVKDLRE